MPLTDPVRIDEQVVRDAAGRLRPAVTELFGEVPARSGPIADVFIAIDALEELVRAAKRVPLTNQLRVPREPLYELLDRLRVAVPQVGSNP
ncbi:MAG: hypothetical protein ACRDPC_14310 [Solirubrobacteraceae bacterium]